MRAGEHETQAVVRRARGAHLSLDFFDAAHDLGFAKRCGLGAASRVDELSFGGGEQPRFRIIGRAGTRPRHQRGGKRVRQRIFGGGDIARARREQSHETTVALTRDALGNALLAAHIGTSGRTSMPP